MKELDSKSVLHFFFCSIFMLVLSCASDHSRSDPQRVWKSEYVISLYKYVYDDNIECLFPVEDSRYRYDISYVEGEFYVNGVCLDKYGELQGTWQFKDDVLLSHGARLCIYMTLVAYPACAPSSGSTRVGLEVGVTKILGNESGPPNECLFRRDTYTLFESKEGTLSFYGPSANGVVKDYVNRETIGERGFLLNGSRYALGISHKGLLKTGMHHSAYRSPAEEESIIFRQSDILPLEN